MVVVPRGSAAFGREPRAAPACARAHACLPVRRVRVGCKPLGRRVRQFLTASPVECRKATGRLTVKRSADVRFTEGERSGGEFAGSADADNSCGNLLPAGLQRERATKCARRLDAGTIRLTPSGQPRTRDRHRRAGPKESHFSNTRTEVGWSGWQRPYSRPTQECLSKLILFGEASLRCTLGEFEEHFHAEWNH